MDLLYLLHSLLKKKWIIIFSSIVGLGAGIAFSLTMKKTYTSLAQYSTGFTMGQKVKIQGDESINIFEVDFQFKNVSETFRSPVVMGMLSYKLLLHDLESKTPFRILNDEQKKQAAEIKVDREKIKALLRLRTAEMTVLSNAHPDEKKILELINIYGYSPTTLAKGLLIERVQQSDYLNIWFRSENPELSAFVVNEIGVVFDIFYSSLYIRRSNESAVRLDSMVNTKKKEVDQLTRDYQEFMRKQGAPDIAGRATAAQEQVNELTSRSSEEDAKLNKLRQQLAAVNSQLASLPTATVSKNNNAEIASLLTENRELSTRVADDPSLKLRIDANIRRIQELTPSGSSSSNPAKVQEKREDLTRQKLDLEAEIRAAQENVGMYSRRVGAASIVANTGGDFDVLKQSYESQVTMATNELTMLKGRQQAAQDINVAPDVNFKQTLLGQPPVDPDPSKKMVIVAASGFAMFMLSSLLILFLSLIDGSLRSPSVFLRNTRLNLLGTLNKINLKKKHVTEYFTPGIDGKRSEDDNLFIENIRKLRFEIENTGKKIFLFTSNTPKTGKSTILEGLASSFSLSKKRILLIDSNFSNNSLTRQFEAKPNLQNFSVNGERNILDKFYGVISKTQIPGVDVIGCNEGNFTPSEILPKNNLLDNIRVISGEYDFVFIEGASLNNHADSKELSKYVDGIVSVFSSHSTIRQTDKESIHFLRSTGNKFVGAVLNGVEPENIDL